MASGCSRSTRTSGSASRPRSAPAPRSPPSSQRRGIGKGDRVALAMVNLPEWPIAFFAITALGAIAVPLNAWWTGAELEYGLADSGAKALICDAGRARADRAASRRAAGPAARHRQPRRDGGRPARGSDRRRRRPGRTCPPPTCPTVDIHPDDEAGDLLHQRHHRQAQGRARHPPQPDDQHPLDRLCDRARGAAPRRGAARADAAGSACWSSRSSTSPPARRA